MAPDEVGRGVWHSFCSGLGGGGCGGVCISGSGGKLSEGLALVLVLVSLRREGRDDGTALTLLSVGGAGPNNQHEVEGGRVGKQSRHRLVGGGVI